MNKKFEQSTMEIKKDKTIQGKEQKNYAVPGACTCMTLTSKSGKHYWFRTCDIETDLFMGGAHIVEFPAGAIVKYCDGKEEVIQYSYCGMTYNWQDSWLLDGVNKEGLIGGLLMLYEGTSVDKAACEKEGYVGMELVTKMLSSCKNVKEVVAMVKRIQVLNIPYESTSVPATMHYFFMDSTGEEVILEATDAENPGILSVYSHEEILGIMTNSPSYQEQLRNLSWFMSRSPELQKGLQGQAITELNFDGRIIKAEKDTWHISLNGTFPGSYSSYDRFIRMAILKALNKCGNEIEDEKMLALGSNLMNAVNEPPTQGLLHYTKIEKNGNIIGQKKSYTQYMIMYDIAKKTFHVKAYDSIFWTKYELEMDSALTFQI